MSINDYSEDSLVEHTAISLFHSLGWETKNVYIHETFGQGGTIGRDDQSQVLLRLVVLLKLESLNPGLPDQAYLEAFRKLELSTAGKTFIQNNHEKYQLCKDGIPVSYKDAKGKPVRNKKLKIFDFKHPENNNFLAVQQLWVRGKLHTRRPDIVCFVNGIPLVFIELKAHHTDIQHAYVNNLKDYKDTIPHLFHYNAFIILSNGIQSRLGTITSQYEHFLEWKRISEEEEGRVSIETVIRGTCSKENLMDIFENFLLFDSSQSGKTIKLLARNHQYLGVNKAIDSVRNIYALKGRLGVFWHTQGSGKSYSMIFFCQKIHRKLPGDYTFMIVTDRQELDRQIYETFSGVEAVKSKKAKATSSENLKELLSENHRYIFTLIHKFYAPAGEIFPVVSERDNIIVISDEAHRTQYGSLALNMRNALPNASFIGFTGTPLISDEIELTRNIFGDYVSVYDFKRSVDDGATVPLYYENRGGLLNIRNPELDNRIYEVLDGEDLDDDQRRKLEREFSREYPVLTSQKRLDSIARDIVWHFNERGYKGKAMVICIDKPTAVRMFDLITVSWQEYIKEKERHYTSSKDDQEALELKREIKWLYDTEICIVVSQEANEIDKFRTLGLNILTHREKMVKRNLEKEFKDEDNPFRIAIVCAMWITGFDVPSLSTLYIDKPLKGHTLMQTIARANRVFEGKNNGEIIDYINVYRSLQEALSIYGKGGIGVPGSTLEGGESPVDPKDELVKEVERVINACKDHLKGLGFELKEISDAGEPLSRLTALDKGVEAICVNDNERDEFEKNAREVFKKYQALMPDKRVNLFRADRNAINAMYEILHQKVVEADITELMLRLQQVVDESVTIDASEPKEYVKIDLNGLDFDRLRKEFEKTKEKGIRVQQLKRVIEEKLEEMLRMNPGRIRFYERYQEIIEEYNREKDRAIIEKTFEDLVNFVKDLADEDKRAMREGLDEEYLAIYDLLLKESLDKKEREKVKQVSKELLDQLKSEKLKMERWRESTMITAQVQTFIYTKLYELPQEKYPENEIPIYRDKVYQYVYEHYGYEGFAA